MAYRWTLTNLSDNSSEVLTADPLGWDEGIYKISRSEKYKGAFHEYTTSLKFHCKGGGKAFIDNVYQTEDIDGRISVLIEYDCDGSGTYETLFEGIINLASYKEDGEYTYVNIEKSDLLTKLMSRSEISVDLETDTSIGGEAITPITPKTIPLSPIEIIFESEYIMAGTPDIDGYIYSYNAIANFGGSLGIYKQSFFTHLAGLIKNDFAANAWSEWEEFGEEPTDSLTFQKSAIEPLFEFNGIINGQVVDSPITVFYEIEVDGDIIDEETFAGQRDNITFNVNLYHGYKKPAATGILLQDFSLDAGTGSADVTFDMSFTNSGSFTLSPGQKVWLAWFYRAQITDNDTTLSLTWNYRGFRFKMWANTTYSQTDCKTVLVHEALNAVVDAIADSDNNFDSDFYGREDSEKVTYDEDGEGSMLAISNGLNIRVIPDKKIFCSLDDLFDSLDCLHNIGLGIVDGKVKVEPLSYWFSNTEIISLPNVPKFETKNQNSLYFNKIDIGYQRWETEFKNGLDEPCTKHEYSSKIASVRNTYTKLCKYIASSYAWELTRRKNVGSFPDEDFTYDNENFLLALTKYAYAYYDGYLPELYSDAFNTGTGMENLTTAYNLRLTPKRMLLAHLNKLTGALQTINGNFEFVNGEGNTALQVAMNDAGLYQEDFNGQVLGENDSIAWDEANAENIAPIWLPEIFNFEYPLTFSQFTTIKNNPYGYISFYKFLDDIKRGYIMNMEYSMKTGMTKFELLRKP